MNLSKTFSSVLLLSAVALALLTSCSKTIPPSTADAVGPARIRFTLPVNQVGHPQAVMSTGQPDHGVVVFVLCPDAKHLQVSFDLWGLGKVHRSKPIEIKPGKIQDLVVEFTALYPLSNPKIQALSPQIQKKVRGVLRAELNGENVLSVEQETADSNPLDVVIGRSAIGGSLSDPYFHGDIVSAERLPLQTPLMLIDQSAVLVKANFASGLIGSRQPLFSIGERGENGTAFVEQVAEDSVQFGFVSAKGETALSSPTPTHGISDVTYLLGFAENSDLISAKIKRKGVVTAGPSVLRPIVDPVTLRPGISGEHQNQVASRFLGSSLEISGDPDQASVFDASTGAYELFITLPTFPPVSPQAEPLLITGSTGKGDLVSIRYVDAKHVIIGIDHWGVTALFTDPVEIDYTVPHRVTISHSALFPPPEDAFWKKQPEAIRDRCLNTVLIAIDGKPVLHSALSTYPTSRTDITIGQNLIGGSSCGPKFSGTIHSIRRSGVPASLEK